MFVLLTTFNSSLVQVVEQASNSISSIASEFVAMDQQIAMISRNQMNH